ncbi:hypothetical protein GBAR_LOCUS26925 [Geodia barretti]|uniref:Uncharacterized protein n=1 Tax=Geodia barretti TaxID=519541 RepID=A0AA35XFG9_GEOBA|nr:hypothetical protein GBAR_LOCUS26925 [Geodia barretti]
MKTEGDGVGAEEVPGDISRDTEHPLSVTAVTLCSLLPSLSLLILRSPQFLLIYFLLNFTHHYQTFHVYLLPL